MDPIEQRLQDLSSSFTFGGVWGGSTTASGTAILGTYFNILADPYVIKRIWVKF
jgi:hypothetical protein